MLIASLLVVCGAQGAEPPLALLADRDRWPWLIIGITRIGDAARGANSISILVVATGLGTARARWGYSPPRGSPD